MSGAIDVLDPDKPKRVVVLASNPAVSEQTGWPIGFWWAELTHPFWEFHEHGCRTDVASPEGGNLEADSWSDPRDGSGYSADDLISLGFVNSAEHMKLVEVSKPLADVRADEYDALLVIGRIEDEARRIEGTNFIVSGRSKPHAVRDGLLITGQQQCSGAASACLIIEVLGR